MTSPSTFRAGDTVALTYRGRARNGSDDGYVTLDNKSGSVHLSTVAASDISVTSRALQVGDTLLGSELQNAALPVGSVIRGSRTFLRTINGWCADSDALSDLFASPDTFTIVYLPA